MANSLNNFCPTISVATVDKESQYVHTNANFKITCDFVGKEKPTSVTWSHKATSDAASTPVTSDTADFGLELIKDNTQAILTKSKPVSADDGEYSCAFQFTENPSVQGTAKANIIVACKCAKLLRKLYTEFHASNYFMFLKLE